MAFLQMKGFYQCQLVTADTTEKKGLSEMLRPDQTLRPDHSNKVKKIRRCTENDNVNLPNFQILPESIQFLQLLSFLLNVLQILFRELKGYLMIFLTTRPEQSER
ncbi:hypothetical protein SAMN04488511_11829 [Pedobacter suwonensis]|uniref:Uncharacterized protein n=1 Tax=Pedobacter suwonensis TaxID=332999 RepID=A0A1I0U1U0_9SPHI|nr:hypothetical protein SAMN04488511_11829 [Pedobacter suwonensis]